jgi:polysaccharide biosynthesis/export protein
MWTSCLSCWSARFVLLACLVFSVTNALESQSAKPAETPEARLATWVRQGEKQAPDHPNASSAKHVDDDYLIGPSDVLSISVWKDTELTRTVLVRPDGKITLPLIGELEVNGLTASNVQRLVTQKLKAYISDPQVAVIVAEVKSRTYSVLGKIGRPGSYGLGKPTTVLEAIAIAGAFLEFAKPSKIYIIRPISGGATQTLFFDYKKVVKGRNPEQNVELKNGDTIVVP